MNSLKYGKDIDIEEKIRPEKKRSKYYLLHKKDIKLLMEPFVRKFRQTDCPNCGCSNKKIFFKKNIFKFTKCEKCNTVYINPRPTKDILDRFYREARSIRAFDSMMGNVEKNRVTLFFVPRMNLVLDILRKYKVFKGKLLEVGCGIGTFLKLIRKKVKLDLFGLDPDIHALGNIKSKDISTTCSTLEDYDCSENEYDIILNFETIEHIYSPLTFLKKINYILKPSGLLIFTTPNYLGFDILILGKEYKNIYGPNHLNYFNAKSINMLLKRAGFKTLFVKTPGILDVTIVKNEMRKNGILEKNGFIKHLLTAADQKTLDNFQKYLQENQLSSNMLVCAQKI